MGETTELRTERRDGGFLVRDPLGYNGGAMKRILIVDDEEMIVRTVKAYLDREGFKTYTAYDGDAALQAFDEKGPDLIVLDLMLPKRSGIEVTRAIRAKSSVPIIMLTAKAAEADRVVGLELGADDYVVKPFSPRELVARIRAVLRRYEGDRGDVERIVTGEIEIDLKTRELKVAERNIELTPTEFDLLAYLARHPGQVFTRLQLLREVQGYTYDSFARTIDTHVKNLRRKIEEDPKSPRHILTVHGVGYRFARES
ncbi:MAG: response regulator transcription factor [Candidatus Bipolaricaulia bacterium]